MTTPLSNRPTTPTEEDSWTSLQVPVPPTPAHTPTMEMDSTASDGSGQIDPALIAEDLTRQLSVHVRERDCFVGEGAFSNTKYQFLYWEALRLVMIGEPERAVVFADAAKDPSPARLEALDLSHLAAMFGDDMPVAPFSDAGVAQLNRLIQPLDADGTVHPLPKDPDLVFERIFLNRVWWNSELLTEKGFLESIDVTLHNQHLWSRKRNRELKVLLANETLRCLDTLNFQSLTPQQKVTAQLARWEAEIAQRGTAYSHHTYQFEQIGGLQVSLPEFMTTLHPLKTVIDARNYLERLRRMQDVLLEATKHTREAAAKGIVPPQFVLQKVIDSVSEFIGKQTNGGSIAANNILFTHFSDAVAEIDVTGAMRDELFSAAKHAIRDSVIPGYLAVRDMCTELLDQATADAGVWKLPEGESYYAYKLAERTTTDMTPDEIHEIGQKETKKIQNAMRQIFRDDLGYDPDEVDNASLAELMKKLQDDPKQFYPNTEDGKARLLHHYEEIIERSRTDLGHLFNVKPNADVEVKRIAPHAEEGAPGAYYYAPSFDGTRPGVFYVNARDTKELPIYGMETLAIHEAEPGHHFQLAIQAESSLPVLRRSGANNAFCEGWALYTEKLAFEEGFYSDAYSKLGHYQDELLRATRLVVDTGLHSKKWTRDHAVEWMTEATGYARETVVTEVERYCVWPGQACSYKIGQLKLLELRDRVRDALGEAFSYPDFHDLILTNGTLPLAVVEHIVDDYIVTMQGGQ